MDAVRVESVAEGEALSFEFILRADYVDPMWTELLRNLELLEAWKGISQGTDFET